METLTQAIKKKVEEANALTLKAIKETYLTALRSNRHPPGCTYFKK